MFSVMLLCMGILFEKANSGSKIRIVASNDDDDDYEEDSLLHDRSSQERILNFTVRLSNSFSNSSKEGRLEIYYSGSWGAVSENGFTNASARVACASLGFGKNIGAVIDNRHQAGEYQVWLNNVSCVGTESGIGQCIHSPFDPHVVGQNREVSISCECGVNHFLGHSGNISSPDFPTRYGQNLDCYNYIEVNSGYAVIITFFTFDIATGHDWVMVSCESGKAVRSPFYSGTELPTVLIISSCSLVNVHFHTGSSAPSRQSTGFSLAYNLTSDNVMGGFTTTPSNAFPRTDKDDPVIFNCTTNTEYLPWWTINYDGSGNYSITNSTCGVITSALSNFNAETLGPGSCNLIVIARGHYLNRLSGSLLCTDSTLSSTRAILAPITLELMSTTGPNFMSAVADKGLMKDDVVKISCNPSFTRGYSSLVFTHFLYRGGPVVLMRILITYWTSQGNNVSSNDTSKASSYVLVKALAGTFPRYTCNIVCDFYSNISDIIAKSPFKISFSTEVTEVWYWPTEDNMIIGGHNNGHIRASALLNCHAAANPAATYTWRDESNGNTTIGATITINHSGNFTCKASNIIRGQVYEVSKSVYLLVVEDNPENSTTVLILLGIAVLTMIVIILTTLLIRKCYQQGRINATDAGHEFDGNEHELRQNGGRNNHHNTGIDESGYDNPNRRLPDLPTIYDELFQHSNGERVEGDHYETVLEDDIAVYESKYDYPDASEECIRNLSAIYDEIPNEN